MATAWGRLCIAWFCIFIRSRVDKTFIIHVYTRHTVVNHCFTAPARGAAGQIGFAVAVGVEQLGDFGFLELLDVSDVVGIGGFLVDQVTLCSTIDVDAFAVEFVVAAGCFVLVGM
ncbi:hypothetical protein SSYM_1260 [Serratia symbiotica str. Tucson]|uniref:Uncharacterized protein n=1 Tax=Serratia symbiotica str. Tucson TaxID=914128 RepID=E9CLW7_9GAMM|nr:hypothetical protein SSYM_1260 [Serratia symbiotica str. Tucson]